jgi:hypothetical protein
VGAIIVLMNDVAVDTEELTVGVSASLQAQVLLDKLHIHAGAEHKVATHALLGPTGHPTCVSRGTNGGVQVGVCNGRGHCHKVGIWGKCPGVPIATGTGSPAIRAEQPPLFAQESWQLGAKART